eukprot:gene2218-2360_t
MSSSRLTSQLQAFREKALVDQISLNLINQESPLERMRREIQEELEQSEKYRASILQNVTTFAGLSIEAIHTAARSMEEVFYKKGDIIIYQDDIGDSFYVLEEGLVSVTRKANSKDVNEAAKELVKLGKNAHFGEISLLTAEPRSATVTVLSDEAKCLRMTKQKFDELLATTNQLQVENRKQIGRDVLDTVPLFKSLTSVNKKKLLDAMIPMTYHPQSYICRQGTTGNVFFILTEGSCKVTVNTQEGSERELAKLHPGDFFGEVALIEPSNRRTANVISLETVNCLTLSRNDFNRLLKSLKVKILEHQATRGVSTHMESNTEIRQLNSLSRKRRISGYNTHGQRDELRIANILRRFARFTTESLWNSLYSRMYREMLLDSNKINEYGKFAAFVMKSSESRWDAVKAICEQAQRILETDPSRRTPADHSFIFGLMKQRNLLKDRLCKNWPIHQYMLLCKKVKIMRVKSFRKIIEVDTRGTTVFMILRGSVRIFSRMPGAGSKVIYEEDLFPGEIFGEAVLSGMHTRLLTALSITCVDLAVIDDQDYMTAQDRDSVHMGTEEKSKFLASVPMFRSWDSYKLLRLAHALVQDEIDKGAILTRHHNISKDIYFIVNGRVDVIDSLHKRNILTSLMKHDYFGESGFLNKYIHKIPALTAAANNSSNSNSGHHGNSSNAPTSSFHQQQSASMTMMNDILKSMNNKVLEEFYMVATTKLEVLILNENNFHLFDMLSIESFRDAFFSKIQWRRDRVQLDKAYHAALVHPLDERMNSEAFWLQTIGANDKDKDKDFPQTASEDEKPSNSKKTENPLTSKVSTPTSNVTMSNVIVTPHEKKQKEVQETLKTVNYAHQNREKHYLLNNLQDIPVLLAQDYDLLMVSSSCHSRHFGKAHDFLKTGKRPLSGKTVPYRTIAPGISSEISRPNTAAKETLGTPAAAPNFNDSLSRPSSPTFKHQNSEGIAFYEEYSLKQGTFDEDYQHLGMIPEKDPKESGNNTRQNSPTSTLRRSNSRKLSTPFVKPAFSLDEPVESMTGRKGSVASPTSKKKEYQFRFVDDDELVDLGSPVLPNPASASIDLTQQGISLESYGVAFSPSVRRASTANFNQLKRPSSSPQLAIPSYDTTDAKLMVIKPFGATNNSKTPTAAMIANSGNRSRSATKRLGMGNSIPVPIAGEKAIEQLLARRATSAKRKSSYFVQESYQRKLDSKIADPSKQLRLHYTKEEEDSDGDDHVNSLEVFITSMHHTPPFCYITSKFQCPSLLELWVEYEFFLYLCELPQNESFSVEVLVLAGFMTENENVSKWVRPHLKRAKKELHLRRWSDKTLLELSPTLEVLKLFSCHDLSLPSLPNLKSLAVDNCQVENFETCEFQQLQEFSCSDSRINRFQKPLKTVKKMSLEYSSEGLDDFNSLTKVTELNIDNYFFNCDWKIFQNLRKLTIILSEFNGMCAIDLPRCSPHLQSFTLDAVRRHLPSSLKRNGIPKSLRFFQLYQVHGSIDFNLFQHVQSILLEDCTDVKSLVGLGNIPRIKLTNLRRLTSLDGLGAGGNCSIEIDGCSGIVDFSAIKHVREVTIIRCSGFRNSNSVNHVHHLTIRNCENLRDISSLSKVHTLLIDSCDRIHSMKGLEKNPKVTIINCPSFLSAESFLQTPIYKREFSIRAPINDLFCVLPECIYSEMMSYLQSTEVLQCMSCNTYLYHRILFKVRQITLRNQNMISLFLIDDLFRQKIFDRINNPYHQLTIAHRSTGFPWSEFTEDASSLQSIKMLELIPSRHDDYSMYSLFKGFIDNRVKETLSLELFQFPADEVQFPLCLQELKLHLCSVTTPLKILPLPKLKKLTLSHVMIGNLADLAYLLEEVHLEFIAISCDLSVLNRVRKLTMKGCEGIRDYRGLQDNEEINFTVIDIESFDFTGCFENHLPPKTLKSFQIQGESTLSDLKKGFEHLKTVHIISCKNFNSVDGLGAVETVYLCLLPSLMTLTGLGKGNKEIHLQNLEVSDYKPICNVPRVSIFNCSEFVDSSQLDGVKYLDLCDCSLEDVSTLSHLHQLRLHTCNEVRSIEGLLNIPELIVKDCRLLMDYSNVSLSVADRAWTMPPIEY